MTFMNLTKDQIDPSFSKDQDFLDTLSQISDLWLKNRLPRHDLSTFRPENRDSLLTEFELNRLKQVYKDVIVCQSARVLEVTVPFPLRLKIEESLLKYFPEGVSAFTGSMWYRPGGYMTWHTNSNGTGHRMYMTYATTPNMSFFRYEDVDSGQIQTSYDVVGWQLRIFSIGRLKKFWHCVSSDTERLSLGVQIGPFGH